MELLKDFNASIFFNIVFDQSRIIINKIILFYLILAGANGDGIMRVTAKQRFDREGNFPGKRVRVPINVSDRELKGSNQVVYLIIGDLVS